MDRVEYDCDCDRVIEMEEMGIGVEEILQYVQGVLPREDLEPLMRGLEKIVSSGDGER